MNTQLKAFNLIEILTVLAIIGILILAVLPNHGSVIAKAKAVEAKTNLAHIHSLQKMYFYEHSKYAPELMTIDFEPSLDIESGGSANYKFEIVESSSAGFLARAEAVVDFDGDGVFNVWEIDQKKNLKEIVKD